MWNDHHNTHRRSCAAPRRVGGRVGGFTLPEALLAMVVISVGLTGLLLAFSTVARSSADPVVHKQMLAIAQALMEEITLKPYAAAANSAPGGCARDTYNDLADFNGYSSTGICTVDGVAIAQLASYNVSTTVASGTLFGVSAAKTISVTVSHAGETVTLTGWRTDYASP